MSARRAILAGRRGGMTLIELSIGLLVTSIVMGALASLWFAVARTWGHFGDFKENMRARQDDDRVEELAKRLDQVRPRVLVCPSCGATIPTDARGRFTCSFCHSTLEL